MKLQFRGAQIKLLREVERRKNAGLHTYEVPIAMGPKRRRSHSSASANRAYTRSYNAKQRILANAMKALLKEQGISIDDFCGEL